MKNKLKFTVLTPVYNRQDCIERCIKSVLSQKYGDVKHLIINDGSTDNTLEIIKNYKNKYPEKIDFISYNENKGINYAFNRGLEKLEDGFCIVLGSDDWLAKNAIEIILSYIEKYANFLHYMFIPDDKLSYVNNNPILIKQVNIVGYEDWLAERVTGDFVHVIHSSVLKKFPFYEEFRLYEGINFLRFYRYTQKQLIIKKVVVLRDRNRKDHLTKEGFLFKKGAINNEFKALDLYLSLFGDDLLKLDDEKWKNKIKRYIKIGLACGNYELICSYYNYFDLLDRFIYHLKLGLPMRILIKCFSATKYFTKYIYK